MKTPEFSKYRKSSEINKVVNSMLVTIHSKT